MSEQEEHGPYAAFGKWLRDKRVAANLASQSLAEVRARARGLKLINQGKLSHIERGMNGNPDPKFLEQLATLYKLNYSDVVAAWMRVRYAIGNDVDSGHSRHDGSGTGGQTARQVEGGADVPAEARSRIAELEQRVADFEALVGEMQNVALRLFEVAALGEKGGQARRRQRKSSGTARKIG